MTISIHEAAKASTGGSSVYTATVTDFNPRSRKGFDQGVLSVGAEEKDFNPRSRKGFDSMTISTTSPIPISIHEAAKASTS